jgi:DNA-binding IclR family transcriptional regulator
MASDIVIQDPNTKTYKLGTKLISLGMSALNSFDLHNEALPLMKKLRDETGETVNLSILDGNEILIIERFRSNHLYSMNLTAGSRLPIYCTSQGRSILAFMGQQQRDDIIDAISLIPLTQKTIVNKKQLLEKLDEIRVKGFAVNREEFEIGICAVAAPVLNHDGEAVASINVSFAIVRHPEPEFMQYLSGKVIDACRQLSLSMGYVA